MARVSVLHQSRKTQSYTSTVKFIVADTVKNPPDLQGILVSPSETSARTRRKAGTVEYGDS